MKRILLSIWLVATACTLSAQNGSDRFTRIGKMISQGHYTSAYEAADSLRREALKNSNASREARSRQLLTATWYMERAAINYQEDVPDSSMARFRAILPYLTPVDSTLCYIFLGNIDSALTDTLALRHMPNTQIAEFCEKPKEARFNTTPTMYDLVMQLAIQNVPQKRKTELQRQLTEWYRHKPATKENTDLLLYNELELLTHLTNQPNLSKEARRSLLQQCLNRYRGTGNEQLAELYYRLADSYQVNSNYLAALTYCDSATARWPKSRGGVDCANLRWQIMQPGITVAIEDVSPAGRDILAAVTTRNIASLHYRVIAYPAWYIEYNIGQEKRREKLLGEKVLKAWSQPLPAVKEDHQHYRHYCYIPQLAPGHYLLIASPDKDFSGKGFVVRSFTVSAAAFMLMSNLLDSHDSISGYVVDYVTGEPLARQKVQLQHQTGSGYDGKYTTEATATTDAHGHFSFKVKKEKTRYWFEYRLLTRHKGLDMTLYLYAYLHEKDSIRTDNAVFLDRPVYRPGDTLQFLLVEGSVTHNRVGRTVGGDILRVELRDVNDKTLDTLIGVTDSFGSLSGRFVIPANVLPGRFSLTAYSQKTSSHQFKSFTVEAYKQPKFTVTLSPSNSSPKLGEVPARAEECVLGDSLFVDGLAASYTQVPVGGAKVVWSVVRSYMRPWWRHWYYEETHSETVTVASDSLTTDAEGLFRIAFVADPDSNMNLATKPCFSYEVRVDVTDLGGETHRQTLTLKAGYVNSYISLDLPDQTAELSSIEYRYCDLNGTPLKGYVTLNIERLKQPEKARLTHPLLLVEDARHTLSEEEFRNRFPLISYTPKEALPLLWPAERKVFDTRVLCNGMNKNSIALPRLEPGIYRVSIATDGETSTDTAVVVYIPQGCKKVYGNDLLWSDISTSTARVGDTVVLRVGSRHKDVWVAYELVCGDKRLARRLLRLSDEIKTLRIPVTEALLGGFDINLCAVKEGREDGYHHRVEVPFEHKKLDVKIATFRDKLTPGEKETWTITVSPKTPTLTPLPAALLLGMYDAALDSYGHGGNVFRWFPWMNTESKSATGVDFDYPWHYHNHDDLLLPSGKSIHFQGKEQHGWTFSALNHRGWRWKRMHSGAVLYAASGTARGESGMVTMTGNVRKRTGVNLPAVTTSLEVVEDDAVIQNEEEGVVLNAAYEVAGQKESTAEEKPYIRNNLSTLAFFEPTLRTDKDGTVTYSFTAPDLLTQWNIEGLAWTRDLSTGHLQRQLITRKELMIQPNMPRFLREGDTTTLLAKVINLTDSTLNVKVDFSFEYPEAPANSQFSTEGRRPPVEPIVNSQFLSLPPHGTVPVAFTVTVPVGGTVATYKYVATATNFSDGEQGPLPLLTNRQAVTQSVSMFTNGKGSKEYTLALPASPTAQPVSFTVEYTSNPLWLAIQSLPYMGECSNPSNIYLFNNYYVNTIGKTIAEQFPALKHCADQATEEDSPLMRNADIRQTLIEETPWLSEGTSEVERLRRIARFYDDATLQRLSSELFSKLEKAQRGDGGWSWMPDGRYSSTYVTQHILKGFGVMARQVSRGNTRMQVRALAYIDKEAYKDYLEWQKYLQKHPGSQCKPIMLDYLYTRSYYMDCKLDANHKQAYDFFYGNAKARHADYTSLYDQALLALVFHRNGDTRLAREMVERIRQKALYSDEMGMYWRDNRAGWYYYQRPVETQALLIETFREVVPEDTLSVGQMQQWLLKQKQTTRWSSDVATLRAIQALLPVGNKAYKAKATGADAIVVRGKGMTDTVKVTVADGSAGYLRHTYRSDSLAALGSGTSVAVRIERNASGISWGALYYQYTEQMDKVAASETGITLRRTLYRVEPDGTLTELKAGVTASVGDRLRVRLEVVCDRNLEYVELKEFRAACLEPVSTSSGWVWSSGLSYYVAINNSHNAVYIDRLEKGKYVIDADYYVTNPGSYTLAPSVLQCLYAPEFRASSQGQRLTVSQ